MAEQQQKRVIALFDVDMTLTPARQRVTPQMLETISKMRAKGIHFGIVSGSDLVKVREQMTLEVANGADWCFAENGLDAYKLGVEVEKQSINKHLGEDNLKKLINFILHYIADLDIPIKRGTFIEFRNGMINVSPIGRNCSKQERDEFEEFDKSAGVRKAFVEKLREEFADLNLRFSIGGQISFDVFPIGWDKSFCLKFIEAEYDEIHFWGDKTAEGGNDHEIFMDSRTIGHSVVNPDETIVQVRETFGLE